MTTPPRPTTGTAPPTHPKKYPWLLAKVWDAARAQAARDGITTNQAITWLLTGYTTGNLQPHETIHEYQGSMKRRQCNFRPDPTLWKKAENKATTTDKRDIAAILDTLLHHYATHTITFEPHMHQHPTTPTT